MSLARSIVRTLRTDAARPLPEPIAQAAVLHLVDALGVGLAAAASPVGAPYRDVGRQLAQPGGSREATGGGSATLLGLGCGAAPADAALINGGLMHSLEFDDTHTGSIMHGSSVIAAAALACAEAQSRPGVALLGAYTRGWEVLARFGLAAPGRFHARGFQATSVAGAVAAALVAAELGGLTEDQSVAAVGIALSQAGGVMEFLTNGSSVKSLHPGWAAHGGVLAATLARAGMTGPETAIEGRHGLFAQFCDDPQAAGRFEGLLADIGSRWHMPDAGFKFYPCCHYLHPFLEAAGLLAERGVRAGEIRAIVCEVPAGAAPVICEPWARALDPVDGHAARWSLPITVATRLIEGRVDLATFEAPASAAVRALAAKTRWIPLQDARFPARFEAVVTCELENGRRESVRVDDVDGNHTRRPAPERVLAKFRGNAGRLFDAASLAALENHCTSLASAPALDTLTAALRRGVYPGVNAAAHPTPKSA